MNIFKKIHFGIIGIFGIFILIILKDLFSNHSGPFFNRDFVFYYFFVFSIIIVILLLVLSYFIYLKDKKLFIGIIINGSFSIFGMYYYLVLDLNSGILGPFLFFNSSRFTFKIMAMITILSFSLYFFYKYAMKKDLLN